MVFVPAVGAVSERVKCSNALEGWHDSSGKYGVLVVSVKSAKYRTLQSVEMAPIWRADAKNDLTIVTVGVAGGIAQSSTVATAANNATDNGDL